MTRIFILIAVLTSILCGCSDGSARGHREGAAAGKTAGARAGQSAGDHNGRAEGDAAGRQEAAEHAREGRFISVYARPLSGAFVLALLAGLITQYVIVHRIANGQDVPPALRVLVSGLHESFGYQILKRVAGLDAIAAATARSQAAEADVRRRAFEEIHKLTVKQLQTVHGLKYQSFSRLIDEYKAETDRLIADAKRRAGRNS